MATIGFVTCAAYPEVTTDDQIVAAALRRRGHDVIAVPWNGDWQRATEADLLLLRSAWDVWRDESTYHGYQAWFDRIEAEGIALWNPPSVARWSLDKRYIMGLPVEGVHVPESIEVKAGDLVEAMAGRGWSEAVFKPAVGGSGDGVELIDRTRATELDRDGLPLDWTPWMLQEFVPEIRTRGETSIVVIDGEVTHAVRKLPQGSEYRSNSRYGAQVTTVDPGQLPLEHVAAVLAVAPRPLLYARIDLVIGERTSLIEFEGVDPSLAFATAPEAADRLAAAVEARLP